MRGYSNLQWHLDEVFVRINGETRYLWRVVDHEGEVLNAEWFATTKQAQIVINHWLRQYNRIRPHQVLNMRPPVPETPFRNGPEMGD